MTPPTPAPTILSAQVVSGIAEMVRDGGANPSSAASVAQGVVRVAKALGTDQTSLGDVVHSSLQTAIDQKMVSTSVAATLQVMLDEGVIREVVAACVSEVEHVETAVETAVEASGFWASLKKCWTKA